MFHEEVRKGRSYDYIAQHMPTLAQFIPDSPGREPYEPDRFNYGFVDFIPDQHAEGNEEELRRFIEGVNRPSAHLAMQQSIHSEQRSVHSEKESDADGRSVCSVEHTIDSVEYSYSTDDNDSFVLPPLKRTRNNNDDNNDNNNIFGRDDSVHSSPKKAGRPPKVPNIDSTTTTPKRKVGRPSKLRTNTSNEGDVTATVLADSPAYSTRSTTSVKVVPIGKVIAKSKPVSKKMVKYNPIKSKQKN
jgi:hypothetical protein